MVTRMLMTLLAIWPVGCSDGSDFAGGGKQIEAESPKKEQTAPSDQAVPAVESVDAPRDEPVEDKPRGTTTIVEVAGGGGGGTAGGLTIVGKAMAPCGDDFPILAGVEKHSFAGTADCSITCLADMEAAAAYQTCKGNANQSCGYRWSKFYGNGHKFSFGSVTCQSAAATGMIQEY